MPANTPNILRLLVTTAIGATIASTAAQEIPSGGASLVDVADIGIHGSFYSGTNNGQTIATRTIVDVSGQSFAQAAQIDVPAPNGEFWSSAVTAQSNRALADGDVVLLHLFLRAIATTDETGTVSCYVYAEGPAPGYTKSISQSITAGPQWVEYFLPFEVEGSYAAGEFGVKVGFGAGARPQTLEIADARAIWYGKARTLDEMPRTSFQYEGRAPDASWRSDAAARIEEYRKANYTVRVVNTAGLPVSDARVRVKLRRHAFHFGCSWDAALIVDQSTTDNQNYRTRLLELFNAGSTGNDLKWPPWIGEWGSGFSRTQTLEALAWMHANSGFHLRGHVLVWPGLSNLPNFLRPLVEASDPTVPQRVIDHIADIVPATKDYVPEWDVINEPYDNHDIMDRYGDSVMVDWFTEARKHHATARLYINDYAIISGGGLNEAKQDAYAATIQYLLDNGAPVDGVGFQGHFDASPTGISKAWSIMQRYATEFPDLEFKITEFDVDTDDEQIQADYLRDFLTLVFSHPKFTGFQVWGYWEGAHWKPRAAMVRLNWEEKPNAAVWRALVLDQWQTDETRTTAPDGRTQGRGFLGDYDVVVTSGGIESSTTFSIDGDGASVEVVIDVPVDGAPRITREPFGTTVSPGEEVRLAFDYSGDPAPTITWFKDGAPLGPGGPELVIASASAGTEGVYFSELNNPSGTARTRDVRVGVRAPDDRLEKLVNISTRGQVLSGDQVMIAGFVVDGSGAKDVLIRGVGPRLADFGVPNALMDPTLRLFQAGVSDPIAENDNWDPVLAPVFTQVGAFPLPDDTQSAALRLDLAPGVYSAHLASKDGGSGVAIVEVYDVSSGTLLDLVNISTRGVVGVGNDILIGGFVIQGSVPQRVLVRGVGPKLGAFGVAGTLTDPVLTLHKPQSDGSSLRIAWNDDWMLDESGPEVAATAQAVGAFALDKFSRDACLLHWLEPGAYTVHLAGAANDSGIAMIEVYAVP